MKTKVMAICSATILRMYNEDIEVVDQIFRAQVSIFKELAVKKHATEQS